MSNKPPFVASLLNIIVLCAIIIAFSVYFVYNNTLMGYVLLLLGAICLLSLKVFRISMFSVQPDIIFGIIDNGILAVMAILGGELAGVAGAIAGGVVGNAVTDGIAGLFEGYSAEMNINDKRTVLGSSVGKMAGCLFGAGAVLVLFTLIFN